MVWGNYEDPPNVIGIKGRADYGVHSDVLDPVTTAGQIPFEPGVIFFVREDQSERLTTGRFGILHGRPDKATAEEIAPCVAPFGRVVRYDNIVRIISRGAIEGDDRDNEVEIRTMSFAGDMPNRCVGVR